jgi:hypothetical protein
MEVFKLDSTNFIGLSSRYPYDNKLQFNEKINFTKEYIQIPKNQLFKDFNDNSINNFSNLILTNSIHLSSAVNIEKLELIPDQNFTTYFATEAIGSITPNSKFWVVQEPPIDVPVANVALTGSYSLFNNKYLFQFEYLSDKLCKISHENNNVIRYLTVDYNENLYFTPTTNQDSFLEYSPQIFLYVYDKENDFVLLIKNIDDNLKYVSFSPVTQGLILKEALTGGDTSFSTQSVFRVVSKGSSSNSTKFFDPWVSYNKNFKTNSQDINSLNSFENVRSNLLVNSEYTNISSNYIDFNILSLKNTNTPENYQSRNNPFFNEDEIFMRDYKTLFTGSNQELGNDNISVGYESYTNKILLEKDKVTYFHVPQVFYPYQRLNVADSGLIEAGAIAGDHPLKSDKIFKKKADYKYTSHFGDTIDENTGSFLCSWLSGNTNVEDRPIWVDRYYNPKRTSFVAALTTREPKVIRYISIFECLTDKAKELLDDVDVFDKPSDLIFEKGTYYAYHHYGPEDSRRFIETFNSSLVANRLATYKFVNGSDVYTNEPVDTEYSFYSDRYGITKSLSAIQNTNQFTLIFDAYSSDWSKPIGYQLVGNYDSDGFGLFNTNIVTPTLFFFTPSAIKITNINSDILNNVEIDTLPIGAIRQQGLNDYFVVFNDNTIRKFNISNTEIRKTTNDENFQIKNLLSYDYDEENVYLLINNSTPPSVQNKILKFNIYDNTVIDITNNIDRKGIVTNNLNLLKTINLYTENGIDKVYLTPGIKSERIGTDIFFLSNYNQIYRWSKFNTATSTLCSSFFSNTKIEDFNIDFDDNIWVLYNNNQYAKFTADRQFILSGIIANTDYLNYKVKFGADFSDKNYNKFTFLIGRSKTNTNKLIFYKFNSKGNIIRDTTKTFEPTFMNFYAISAIAGSKFSTSPTLSSVYSAGISIGNTVTSSAYTNIVTFNSDFSKSFNPVEDVCMNLSNDSFLRSYINEKYSENTINAKVKLINPTNRNDVITEEVIYPLSGLDRGFHNFAVRFDSYQGYLGLFIDGQPAGFTLFTPRKYKFSDMFNKPIIVGSSSYSFGIPLFSYLKYDSFLANDFIVKNFYLYNKPLLDYDIITHVRQGMNIQDINFDVACGRRNYIEEIERYFKVSTPGSKSTVFDLNLRSSGIKDKDLQIELEKRIVNLIGKSVPAYSKLRNIKWSNS